MVIWLKEILKKSPHDDQHKILIQKMLLRGVSSNNGYEFIKKSFEF